MIKYIYIYNNCRAQNRTQFKLVVHATYYLATCQHHLIRVMENVDRCAVCYHKGSGTLSEAEINSVQDYMVEGYDVNNPDVPSAIRSTCSNALCRKRQCEATIYQLR